MAPRQNQLATITDPAAASIATVQASQNMGFLMNTFDEVWRFAQVIAKSGMTPKGIKTPEQVTVQIMTGFELGLKPMVAVQNIAVINGKPAIPGDLALSIVMASGLLDDHDEIIEGSGDDRVAVCLVTRKGKREIKRTFSVKDAKQAGLWQDSPTQKERYWDRNQNKMVTTNKDVPNDSPWFKYQERMLKMRARGFALRDRFPDVLKGMHLTEEMHGVEDDVRGDMPAIAGPEAPSEDIEDAEIIAHTETVAAAQSGAAKEVVAAEKEQPKAEAQHQAAAPSGPDAPDDEGDEAFDEEAWLLEVRVRFNEAKTTTEVESVHDMFSDTLETMVGMDGREQYETHHMAALERVGAQPEPNGSGGQADDRFPGDDHIKPQEPAASPEGRAFVNGFRKKLNAITARDDVTAHFNGHGGELSNLIADGDLNAEWDTVLRAESTERYRALPKAEKPVEAESEIAAFDREFRAKLQSFSTVADLNAYSTSTLNRRNAFGQELPIWKEWRQAVVDRRNVINGIA